MRPYNESHIDRLYLNARDMLNENKAPESVEVLIEILCEDPCYARAHTMLGHIYSNILVNLERAEKHYLLALKYAKGYPYVVSEYARHLLDCNKTSELILFVDEHRNQLGVDQALLHLLKGNALEMKGHLHKAIKCYKLAKIIGLNIDFVRNVDHHMDRVKMKMSRLAWAYAMF